LKNLAIKHFSVIQEGLILLYFAVKKRITKIGINALYYISFKSGINNGRREKITFKKDSCC
jgi:hypothetical protein